MNCTIKWVSAWGAVQPLAATRFWPMLSLAETVILENSGVSHSTSFHFQTRRNSGGLVSANERGLWLDGTGQLDEIRKHVCMPMNDRKVRDHGKAGH